MDKFKYRPEIDGLRALAVLPVFLFHAGASGFSGGFIGVDVFFVISGYLITGILLKEMRYGNFSFAQFYLRRARRILPALYVVILTSIPLSWIVMMPHQFEDFCQSLVSVSLFAANFFFYEKSGYFEPSSELSPMLHIWSLEVEEQFYFFFPILLFLFYRYFLKAFLPLLIIVSLASLLLAQKLLTLDPDQSFFLPFSRAWELMIGAAINFIPSCQKRFRIYREAGGIAGLTLIIGSIFFLTDESPFPGLLALPPTIGTMLVIYFASTSSLTGKILAIKPLVFIGLISYSAYLWHHVLFAILRLSRLDEPHTWQFVLIILVSIGLAYLTWLFVERPFRDKQIVTMRTLVFVFLSVGGAVLTFGTIGTMRDGFADIKYASVGEEFMRFDTRLQELKVERNACWEEILDKCDRPFDATVNSKKILVLGDSRSQDLYVSLLLNKEQFPNTQFRRVELDELCFPLLTKQDTLVKNKCHTKVKFFFDWMSTNKVDAVLVACGWLPGASQQLKVLMNHLESTPVWVFGTASFNEIDSLFFNIYKKNIPQSEWPVFFTNNKHERSFRASIELENYSHKGDFTFVDVYKLFEVRTTKDSLDPTYNLVSDAGDPLLVDQTHLTVEAARRFGKLVADLRLIEQGVLD